MTDFSFSLDQVTAIATSITGDELARRYNYYADSITQAGWHSGTRLSVGGLNLTGDQITACRERLYGFFGKESASYAGTAEDSFGDWAAGLAPVLAEGVTQLAFMPAANRTENTFVHPAEELAQDARAVSRLVQGRRRLVSMVAPHSLFGFATTILMPNIQKIAVLDGRPLSAEDLEKEIAPGDLIVATPTLWRFLLQSQPSFQPNVVGLSFGEPMTAELYSSLRERGLTALRELYGSTETGIIAWREAPSEGFSPFEHWKKEGENFSRFLPDGQKVSITPMDKLTWNGGKTFSLKGRRDGAVQVGAVNVYPDTIARVIANHPDIEACRVTVSSRGVSLDRLIAHIVLAKGLRPDQTMAWKVDAWCRKNLRPPERPRIYNFTDSVTDLTEAAT